MDETSKCGFETMDEGSVMLVNLSGRKVHDPGRFPPSFLNDHLFAVSQMTLSSLCLMLHT